MFTKSGITLVSQINHIKIFFLESAWPDFLLHLVISATRLIRGSYVDMCITSAFVFHKRKIFCEPSQGQFEIVGNKAKGRISKRVLQENKVRHIFRKTNISHPLIRKRTCAYQGVRNVRFSENLTCFQISSHFLKDDKSGKLLIFESSLFHSFVELGEKEFIKHSVLQVDDETFKFFFWLSENG